MLTIHSRFGLNLSVALLFAVASACPPDGTIRIGGTHSMRHLTQAWADAYMASNSSHNPSCPLQAIEIEGVDYPAGAARVCGNHLMYESVDIAGMSGPFFDPQATTENGWRYDCRFTEGRSTTLLHVGHEGIALVTEAGGSAADCIENHLGGGLTIPQLRWIFSSYSMEQLLDTGLDPTAVQYYHADDDEVHHWDELHPNCTGDEIITMSISTETYANDFIDRTVLKYQDESNRFVQHENSEADHHGFTDVEQVVGFLQDHKNAIGYLQLGDLHDEALRVNSESIAIINVMHAKEGWPVPPEAKAFDMGDYPLARSAYLGVSNDPSAFMLTGPFLQFGLSSEGTKALEDAGFWAIDEWEKIVMRTRLQMEGGVPMEEIQSSCGRQHGMIKMAGSATVYPAARIWSEIYQLGCPTIDIDIEQGGSSAGAGRVCANSDKGSPVEIGNMSRDWKGAEGVKRAGEHEHVYDCLKGDESRSVIQVDVANDGLTVILKKGGIASECEELLGGFTLDQLRWIYSGYSEEELEATGWDPSSLKNSDKDPSTHLWSELDPGCAPVEIELTGDTIGEGTHTNFRMQVLTDYANGEDIDLERPLGYFYALGFDLVSYLQSHGDAISYIGFNYYHDNKELLSAAPIQNSHGTFVTPSAETIGDGTYNPLVRSISMNLLNKEEAFLDTVPLLKFGFSHPDLVTSTGMVPLQGARLEEMLLRLDNALLGDVGKEDSSVACTLLSPWLGLIVAVWLFFW